MSADNWKECPQCIKKAKENRDKLYGKVDSKVYEIFEKIVNFKENGEDFDYNQDIIDKELNKPNINKEIQQILFNVSKQKESETVREDYEVGFDNEGNPWVSYSFQCQNGEYGDGSECSFEGEINYDAKTHKIVKKEVKE